MLSFFHIPTLLSLVAILTLLAGSARLKTYLKKEIASTKCSTCPDSCN